MKSAPDHSGPIDRLSNADFAVLALIFFFALVIRIIYLIEIRDLTFFVSPVIDAQSYLERAKSVAAGRLFEEEAFWQPPLYPYLLGLLIRLFGVKHILLHSLHFVLGAMNCSLIALLGLKSLGRNPAYLAGIAAALYGPFIFFEGEYLIPALSVFLNLLTLLFLFRALSSGAKAAFAGAGLCFGLSAIARPNILLFLPVALVFLLLKLRGRLSGKALAVRFGLLLFCTALPIAPVTAHNRVVSRELTLISANAGNNFYLGNNADWRRTTAIRPDFEWADLTAEPFRNGAITPGERSAYFFDKALSDIKSHPGAWLGSLIVKTGQFFYGHEYPRNVDPYLYRKHSRVLSALLWEKGVAFPWGLISPLALLGLALAVFSGRTPEKFLLALFAVTYVSSVVVFFVASRYRLPMIPVMLLLAASAVFWLRDMIRERKLKQLAAAGGFLVVALIFSNYGLEAAPRAAAGEEHLLLGHSYSARGLAPNAIQEYERARALMPDRPDPWFHLGLAYFRRGENDRAREHLKKALELAKPESMVAAWSYETLGDLSLGERDLAGAVDYYQKSLAAYPFMFGARLSLAMVYQSQGRIDLARAELETLIEQHPRRPEPYLALARLEARSGNPTRSRELMEKARRLGAD